MCVCVSVRMPAALLGPARWVLLVTSFTCRCLNILATVTLQLHRLHTLLEPSYVAGDPVVGVVLHHLAMSLSGVGKQLTSLGPKLVKFSVSTVFIGWDGWRS